MMKVFIVATIMLIAFNMAMAFSHLLEMPARLEYDAVLWHTVTFETETYQYFGTGFGAWVELASIVAAIVLCFVIKERRRLVIASASLLVAAQITWWLWVFPVNEIMSKSKPDTIADVAPLTAQWEYAHATRAIMLVAALLSVTIRMTTGFNARATS